MVHSKRALTLWAILRSFVLSTHRKTTKNLPYQLTIKHGFQNNYQLHTRHQIISSVYHQFTRVLQEPIRDVNSDEDFLFVDVLQGTFVVVLVSDTNHLLYWEINNSQGIIPSPTSYYLDFNLDSIIFLSRFGVYAACSDESWIKFLNQKFQVISTRPTTHSVQHIHYEPATNRLVAIGSHELSSFLLKGKLTRGKLRVDAILETNRVLLSPDEWIKATFAVQKQIIVSVDNKIHLLEAKSLKTIAVVDCRI